MANSIKQHFTAHFQHSRWLLHLLFWILVTVISYFQLRSSLHYLADSVSTKLIYTIFAIKFMTLFTLSYTFQFLLVPFFKHPKKHIFPLLFFALLLFIFLIEILLIKHALLSMPVKESNTDYLSLAYRHFSSYIFSFSFFLAFYYFMDIYDQQKEIRRLAQFKTQKIALESSFLKSQINPHFLFNTLNNIYALSLKKSDQTAVIIDRLESLLHYMLYDCKEDLVPLENEFTFTNSYIALEKLRHSEDQCTVTVTIKGDIRKKKIAPLLLINFLENAFKHGTKASFGKSWINLDIDITDSSIHFKLQNSKPFNMVGQAISDYKGGIGLKNVKRRLEIFYPEQHTLSLNNAKDRFEVDLNISF